MSDEPFHGDPPADLAAGHCLYQEPWDLTPCGASATVHGVTLGVDAGEACDKHRDVLKFHATWVHPWSAACAGGRFVEAENRCMSGDK